MRTITFISRMHSSSRMLTDRRLTVSRLGGVLPPQCRPPSMQSPLHADPLPPKADPPCEQTNTCENITFPHTLYAISKNPGVDQAFCQERGSLLLRPEVVDIAKRSYMNSHMEQTLSSGVQGMHKGPRSFWVLNS